MNRLIHQVIHFYWLSMLLSFTCFMIYGYILSMFINMLLYGNTVRSRCVFGWCLCKDKPYGSIILIKISFRAYNYKYKLWGFLSFYIWTPKKLLYKHRSMFGVFGCFDIVKTIFLMHFLCYIMNDWFHVTLAI